MNVNGAGPARVHCMIVTYNRPDEMAKSLVAALGQTWPLETLVVVDNSDHPVDRTSVEAMVDVGSTRLRLLTPGDNLGPAGGFALSLESLEDEPDDDFVLLLDDDDPLPGPDVLEQLLSLAHELADRDPAFGGIGLRGARFDGRWLRTRGVDPDDGPVQPVDHLHGGYAPLYRLGALRGAGGFRPELFWGFEELETGLRVTASGARLYMAVELLAGYPETSKTTRVRSRPSLVVRTASPRTYYTMRNLLWIGRQRGHRFAVLQAALVRGVLKPLLSMPLAPRAAAAQLRLNLRAIRDARANRLGRTLTW